jgi:hypothetical protein
VASLLAAAVLTGVFVAAVRDIYYRPPLDGQAYSVFRRMVGIGDQPVAAMQFLRANQPSGVVFNEWTHGGFVAFHQAPDPTTGSPPCKLFMDGRAQAAYDLGQYERHQQLAGFASEDAQAFAREMARHGLTAALLDLRKSASLFGLLSRAPSWQLAYLDGEYVIFLRADAPENRPLLERLARDELVWPSPFARDFTRGYRRCASPDRDQRQQGVRMLMALQPPHSAHALHDLMVLTALRCGLAPEAREHLSREYARLKALVDGGQRRGLTDHGQQLLFVLRALMLLAEQTGPPQEVRAWEQQFRHYNRLLRETNRRNREGWFW